MNEEEHIEKKVTDLSFETIKADEAPKNIQNWMKKNRSKKANRVFIVNGKTYVTIQLGQKSTGGYSVKINQIQHVIDSEEDEMIVVSYSVIEPEKGSINIQVLTYPATIAEINEELDYSFQFTTTPKSDKLQETNSDQAGSRKKIE